MAQKRKARGARVEWIKCDCPSPEPFGLYARCPTCDFRYREDPPLTRPGRGDRMNMDSHGTQATVDGAD